MRLTQQDIPPSTGFDPWRDAFARPVVPASDCRHALHAYFNHCPESPDGQWVVLFLTQDSQAHCGDIVMMQRETCEGVTLAKDVEVEDAHRQAYQQWTCDGRYIIFLNRKHERWQVERVDTLTLDRVVLAKDRLLAWSQPGADVAMLYPPHWEITDNRNLDLLDIRTGKVRQTIEADRVCQAVQLLIKQMLPGVHDTQISLFFPVLSPDQSRVMFKLASPTGLGFRHENASRRVGLIVWDIPSDNLVAWRTQWGHPSWHPDSRQIAAVTHMLLDGQTLTPHPLLQLPHFHGSHPNISTDGQWYLSDALLHDFEGQINQWGVAIASIQTGQWRWLFRNPDVGTGTTSCRPPHPHPTFNASGNRIYFNAHCQGQVLLHVLEA